MRYEPLGAWKHGVPAGKAMAVQVFDDVSETEHMNPEYYLPMHGFMVLPVLQVPHGPTLSNLYAKGISENTSCAITAGIEALTLAPAYTGCEPCGDVLHMAGLMARMTTAHPKMVDTMKFSMFTIFKHAIVEELGLPDQVARQDDYQKGVPLPANVIMWAQRNLTPEMMQILASRGLI